MPKVWEWQTNEKVLLLPWKENGELKIKFVNVLSMEITYYTFWIVWRLAVKTPVEDKLSKEFYEYFFCNEVKAHLMECFNKAQSIWQGKWPQIMEFHCHSWGVDLVRILLTQEGLHVKRSAIMRYKRMWHRSIF